MILYIILTVLLLLFVGTTISGTLAERMAPGERAPV